MVSSNDSILVIDWSKVRRQGDRTRMSFGADVLNSVEGMYFEGKMEEREGNEYYSRVSQNNAYA